MKINQFDSFKYVVGNSFSFKNKREVKVFFIYKERYSISLSLMIKKLNFHKEEQYYIDEAKKIVDKMIKNESLEKHSENYIKDRKKKRLIKVLAPIASACALAGISVGIYYAAISPITEYNVTCNIEGVSVINPKAKVGEDYHAILKVDKEKVEEYMALPSTLTRVTSNGKEVTDYTYISHDFTADLIIPKESVKGDVAISASLEKLTSLCFTAQEDNSSISYSIIYDLPNIRIQTSTDETNWSDWNGSEITLNKGEFRYIRNTEGTLSDDDSFFHFNMTGKIAASGNVLSMINYSDLQFGCLADLFVGCASLTTAPALPATTLAAECYYGMFIGCTSLVYAPALPAENLSESCYYRMFENCTSLISAPILPAKVLTKECYVNMFQGCTSLISAPELPAENLAPSCYYQMFDGCTSLTSAPELPAKTLAESCYYNMFYGCSSLVDAPELPAENLAINCYSDMFKYCTSLTATPKLSAKNLAENCYYEMFEYCTSLKVVFDLPATTLVSHCYYYMFGNCTSLTSAPLISATTLADYSCYRMFSGCSSLKVNENGSGTKIFTCPSKIDLTSPVTRMFASTGGTFTDVTPTTGNTYYWYN